MSDWKHKEIKEWHAIAVMFATLLLCIWLLLASGCKVIEKEVPVVVNHTTTEHLSDIVRDTLLMRDSVFHYIKGDTVRVERWHYTTRVEVVNRTDTVRDTIPTVAEVATIREVPKPMPWWQKTLIGLGSIFICFIGFKIVRFFS